MTKSSKSHTLKAARSAKKAVVRKSSKAATRKGSKVLGTTFDGVQILKPKHKATHFTTRELEAAISRVRATRSSG